MQTNRQAEWYIPQHVIVCRPERTLTDEVLQQMNANIIDLLEATSSEKVHVIWDSTFATNVLISFGVSSQTMSYINHPKIGMTAVCCVRRPLTGAAGLMVSMISVAGANDIHIFTTAEDALSYFSMKDRNLREAANKNLTIQVS